VSSAFEKHATINGHLVEIPHLRFHDGQFAYLVIHTASEGLEQLALYQHVLKDFPEEAFVLLKVKFK
jgi:mannitol/fructose-specific phosphotransferase system IIA component